jgi:succinoglycan biosynthesis protein ExoL
MELGVKVTVLGFEREHYKGKPWPIDTQSLGFLKHGEFIRRIGILLKSVLKIRKNIKEQDVVYAFNLDILCISWIAGLFIWKKKLLIYDVADIQSIMVGNKGISIFLRAVERFLIWKTSAIVVASPAYIDGYFKGYQNIDQNFLVIENKLEKGLSQIENHPKLNKDNITIGYFGMIRCEHSLNFLKKLIKNNEDTIHLILQGIFLKTEKFESEFYDLKNARYDGPFVYPDDLATMYSNIDLVWAAHLHGETNSKWSISNRFYQACYFKKPLITQTGTMDAKRVQKYDIGCVIDLKDVSSSIQALKAIGNDQIKQWTKNLQNLPEDIYTYTDEHQQLLNLIKSKG